MVTSSNYTAARDGTLLVKRQSTPIKMPVDRSAGVNKSSFRAVLASRARDKTNEKNSHKTDAKEPLNAYQAETTKRNERTSIDQASSKQQKSKKIDDINKEAVDKLTDAALFVSEKNENDVVSDAETVEMTETAAEIAALMAILSEDLVKLEQLSAQLSQDQALALEIKQSLEVISDALKAQLSQLSAEESELVDLATQFNGDVTADSQVELELLKQLISDTADSFKEILSANTADKSAVEVKALETLLDDLNGHIDKLYKTVQVETTSQTTAVDSAAALQTSPTQTADAASNNAADSQNNDDKATKQTVQQKSAETVKAFSDVADETPVVAIEGERQDVTQVKATQDIKQGQLPLKTEVFEQIKSAIEKDSATAGLADRSTMIVKLKPEALGKVELKIEVHNDNVIAKFNVASQMVKEAIESNFEDLRNSLKDKGFSDMAFDVNVNSGDDNQRDSAYQQQGKRREIKIPSDVEKGETTYIRSLSALINETTFEHSI